MTFGTISGLLPTAILGVASCRFMSVALAQDAEPNSGGGEGGDTDKPAEDGFSSVLSSLGDFVSRTVATTESAVWERLHSGDSWAAMVRLGDTVGLQEMSPLSLRDLGALRALSEITLLQLTLSAQSRVLHAANKSIDDGREDWIRALAEDMRGIAEALHGDRHAIAAGYIALYWLLTSNLRPDADGLVRLESYSSLTQAWWLGRQAAGASVRRLCEIGFNAGHSALAMLLNAPREATMVSFDLGSKSYTSGCADFIDRVFPGRLELVVGPSNVTVQAYAREHLAAPRCDVILIDGGHEEAEAKDDLLAMSLLATHGRTLVVMDDIGCRPAYCAGPTASWEEFRRSGRLREVGCEAEAARRWCWGTYL